jgi:hypothetical protein
MVPGQMATEAASTLPPPWSSPSLCAYCSGMVANPTQHKNYDNKATNEPTVDNNAAP